MIIQDGEVRVNGEVCVQRGKKLHGGDEFSFDGKYYEVVKNDGKRTFGRGLQKY